MDQLVTILGVVAIVIMMVFSHRDLKKELKGEIAALKSDIQHDMGEMRSDIRILTAHVLGIAPAQIESSK